MSETTITGTKPRRFLRELSDGDDVDEIFLASEKQLRTNRNGNLYLQVRLTDRTGSIVGMLWNASQEQYDAVANGDYLRVRGKSQVYNGGLQLILKSLTVVERHRVDPGDFKKLSGADVDRLAAELATTLRSMRNYHLRNLAECFLSDEAFMTQLKNAPAGVKNHHAYHGGLLEHVVSLLKLAVFVSGQYPNLDPDIMTMGVLVHDIGKIRELTYDPELGYTDAGQMLGHMVLGVGLLDERIRQAEQLAGEPFPESLALQLKHLIVSHHGQYEFGSPKLPMSREAVALHLIDTLDARMHSLNQLIDEDVNSDSAWTVYHASLGRKIYKGPLEG